MSKLYFRYGAMGASKTANALMTDYNYRERNMQTRLYTPAIDTRTNIGTVASRIGLKEEAVTFSPEFDFLDDAKKNNIENLSCIIIDESQFLTKKQVYQLSDIVDYYRIPVICYGLRTDFKGDLFEGSHWLFAIADSIEEIKTICFCKNKAIMNARIVNGKVVKEGEQIQIGGNESYIALCRKHWKKGELE